MSRIMLRGLIPLGAVLGLYAQAKPAKTVLDGVYSRAQAGRGHEIYEMKCAMCHEGAEPEGPPLTSSTFVDNWREDSLETLFTFIRTRMPGNAPASLNEKDYLDVVAYLLENNGYRAGSAELNSEGVRNTLFVAEEGPKPLPANAIVRTYGCLSPASGGAWRLTQAAAASRTRDATEITDTELKSTSGQTSGQQAFALKNLDTLNGFNADNAKGRLVLVKGVLNRDSINVMALKPLGSPCTQ